MSAGPKRPHLSIKEFLNQHLKSQRIFSKNEKIWTNEKNISLYFNYNNMDNNSNKDYLHHDTYLNNKENKEWPILLA